MRRLDHPNIAKIYEAWEGDDLNSFFISMEFVPGNLRRIMMNQPGFKLNRKYTKVYMY